MTIGRVYRHGPLKSRVIVRFTSLEEDDDKRNQREAKEKTYRYLDRLWVKTVRGHAAFQTLSLVRRQD